MDGVYIPAPGDLDGPCRRSCGHNDCALIRAVAESLCSVCSEPLGFGQQVRLVRGRLACHRCEDPHLSILHDRGRCRECGAEARRSGQRDTDGL